MSDYYKSFRDNLKSHIYPHAEITNKLIDHVPSEYILACLCNMTPIQLINSNDLQSNIKSCEQLIMYFNDCCDLNVSQSEQNLFSAYLLCCRCTTDFCDNLKEYFISALNCETQTNAEIWAWSNVVTHIFSSHLGEWSDSKLISSYLMTYQRLHSRYIEISARVDDYVLNAAMK